MAPSLLFSLGLQCVVEAVARQTQHLRSCIGVLRFFDQLMVGL